jgi:hypothetical protein
MNEINIDTCSCKILNFTVLNFNYLSLKIKNNSGSIFYMYAHHSSWCLKWSKKFGSNLNINGRSNSSKVVLVEKKMRGKKIQRIFSHKKYLILESDNFVISLNSKGSNLIKLLLDSDIEEPIINFEKDIWTFSLDSNFKIYAIQNDRGYNGYSHLHITNDELQRILNI